MTEYGHKPLRYFFLDQHGCAKNQVDAELIIAYLEERGYTYSEDSEQAQLIIINSCGFTESAKKESLDALFAARKAHPYAKVILAGCLSERYAEVFVKDLPEADAVFGNGDLSKLDFLMDELEKGRRPLVKPEQKGVCAGNRSRFLGFPSSAYIKITEGCNNRCSFCAIPLIRGSLRSRRADEIVDEIRSLLKRGIFEFNLIGQDLAAYGCDGAGDGNSVHTLYFQSPSPLSLLLQKISDLKGSFWLRLLYIHPDHFPADILPLIQKDKRILPYFDLPFQSGDKRIIRAMNRKGSAETYLGLVKSIRDVLPEAVFRTTFLCGFPGETDKEAENTLAFLEKLEPHWSGCFAYSCEEGTPASLLTDKVSSKIVKERIQRLQSTQEEITARLLQSYVGTVCDVLIEECSRPQVQAVHTDFDIDAENGEASFALGRCRFQAPEVDGCCLVRFDMQDTKAEKAVVPGALIPVRIEGVRAVDVTGVPCL